MKSTDLIGGVRALIQDLLVPELKAIQIEISHLKSTLEDTTKDIKELPAIRTDISYIRDFIKDNNKDIKEMILSISKLQIEQQALSQNITKLRDNLDLDKHIEEWRKDIEE